MTIGDLRKQVTIQVESPTTDNAGGYALAWTNLATLWAEIVPVSGQKIYAAEHLEGHITHQITMRYYAGVTTDMRLLYNSRVFNIRLVRNLEEENRWTELLVEEGSAV